MGSEEKKAGFIPLIFSALGLSLIVSSSILSALYIFKGDLIVSFGLGLLILIVFSQLERFLKKKKAEEKDRTSENILRIIYVVMAIAGVLLTYHYSKVEWRLKDELIKNAKEKTNSIALLKGAYKQEVAERQNAFEIRIGQYLNNYILGEEEYKDSIMAALGTQNDQKFRDYRKTEDLKAKEELKAYIETAIDMKQEEIAVDYAIDKNLMKETSDFRMNALDVFDNWKMLKVSRTYNEIDGMYAKLYEAMTERMPGFSHEKPELATISLSNPFAFFGVGWFLIVLVICLACHFLILLEYFFMTERETGWIGPKKKKGDDGGIRLD